MLDYGFGWPYGCWCENCESLFRKQYNMEMPRPEKPSWDEGWEKILEFRANSNTRFSQSLHSFVRSRRPEVSVDFNYHGYPPFSWIEGELPVKHAMNGDLVTCEGLPPPRRRVRDDGNVSFCLSCCGNGRVQADT